MTDAEMIKAIREILARGDQHEPEAIPFHADWSKAPTWARWAAADKCGGAYWYTVKPELLQYGWGTPSGYEIEYISKHHYTRGTVHWTKAIEKRPE